MNFFNTNSLLLAQKSLDFQWQKKNLINDNIANAITPGYKAKYITFEEEFRKRVNLLSNRTAPSIKDAILDSRFRIHQTQFESQKLDGNNVNVESESVELLRAEIQYQYIQRAMNDEFTRLRSAIKA